MRLFFVRRPYGENVISTSENRKHTIEKNSFIDATASLVPSTTRPLIEQSASFRCTALLFAFSCSLRSDLSDNFAGEIINLPYRGRDSRARDLFCPCG